MRQLVYKDYYARSQLPFCLHMKTANCKNIVTDFMKNFHLYFTALIMIEFSGYNFILAKHRKLYKKTSIDCSGKLLVISFWPKTNMQNNAYRKMLNLKISRNSICLHFH